MKNLEPFLKQRLVPVAVIPDAELALPLAEALLEAGLRVIEITLRTDAAMESIRRIIERYPEMAVGAGTVLSANSVHELQELDVRFIVTPGLNEDVIGAARERDLPILPGAITPSEIERARALGLKILKFFPAEAAGGAKMLKALTGPYGHTGVRFVPTGGISEKNVADYAAISSVAAIGGSWFVDQKLVTEKRFDEITRRTREALQMVAPSE